MNTIRTPSTIDENTTVADLVARHPEAATLLVDLGLDTCCGGGSPLGEACQDAQVPLAEVLDAVARLGTRT